MKQRPTLQASLLSLASFVVIVAGMRAAQSLLVVILLSAFLAVILTPSMRMLQHLRVPTSIALLLIILVVAALGTGVVALVAQSFNDFADNLPAYRATLRDHARNVEFWLESKGVPVPAGALSGGQAPPAGVGEDSSFVLDPELALNVVRRVMSDLGGLVGAALIILITVIFMLLEAARFPEKLAAAVRPESPSRLHLREIILNVRRYMLIKTATSLLTGVLVAIFLITLNAPYAMLWGLVAFLLNFVPNIGSIVAAVPAIVLALVQVGIGSALVTTIGYIAINFFVSYAIEPRFMGQGLGLSTLVVFISLMFWGWVLGPIGMLLSAPLTMILKIVLADYEDTRWIAIMLGPKAPRGGSLEDQDDEQEVEQED